MIKRTSRRRWARSSPALLLLLLGSCYPRPDTCGGAGDSCAQKGCCGGLTCARGVCSNPQPVCGDDVCDGNEDPDTCCADCGCPLGRYCSAGLCQALVCGNGRCEAGETAATCCQDCGCAAGQVCSAGACRAPVACGDGRCEAGETAATCCRDCGCAAGQACSADRCVVSQRSTLSWTVTNQCFNGDAVQVRFFDRAQGQIWPSATQVYLTQAGSTFSEKLDCVTGDSICLGAGQPMRGLSWGVGINGTVTCASCCFPCSTRAVALGPLTCP